MDDRGTTSRIPSDGDGGDKSLSATVIIAGHRRRDDIASRCDCATINDAITILYARTTDLTERVRQLRKLYATGRRDKLSTATSALRTR